jgi:hypothetical protein
MGRRASPRSRAAGWPRMPRGVRDDLPTIGSRAAPATPQQCPWTVRGRGPSPELTSVVTAEHRVGPHRTPRIGGRARHDTISPACRAKITDGRPFHARFPTRNPCPRLCEGAKKEREDASNGGGEATGGTVATGQPTWTRARRTVHRVPATQGEGASQPEDRQAGVRHVRRSRTHATRHVRRLWPAQAAPGAGALLRLLQAAVALAPARGDRAPRAPRRPRTDEALSGDQRQRQRRTL